MSVLIRISLARPERFERPTLWFVARYSIQLSYGRAAKTNRTVLKPFGRNFLMARP